MNVVTLRFLVAQFNKNKATGECAAGTYFGMAQNFVVVEGINEDTVKKTLDDLIALDVLNNFLTEI